ncbi:MAG: S1 RNA-binding domain-containing protein [Phycisphaerae bacterium]
MSEPQMDPRELQMPPESSCPQASESVEAVPADSVAAGDFSPDVETGAAVGGEHPAAGPLPETSPGPSAAQLPPVPFTAHQGRVTRVTAEEVLILLEDGRQGTVPLIEFAGQPLPKDGDGVSVIIEREDPRTGRVILSKRHADELTFWESVQPGDELEGVVTGMNKGGLDIDIGGARAFLPASQVDTRRMKDISLLIGEHVRCIVTQVDRTTCDLIVSRKKYLEKEVREKRRHALENLIEGDIRSGTVTNLTEYGAFIDLGGVDGLLHMTDISWGRVRDPREVLQVGQPIRVRILKINHETGKVSLGLKQVKPNPWDGIEERYPKDRRLKAKIARMTDFGAFLELEEGVDALLPIGEMSWSKHVNHPSDVVKIGDEIEVVVLKVDPEKKRISVSLKQTQENPWATVEAKFPINAKVKGKVVKVLDFGAFVEIAPGVEGLVHISELSDKRVKAVSDVVSEGQEVEVRVVKLDLPGQRVSLSMKPEQKTPLKSPEAAKPDKKKGRKRPLRGGLSSHFEW